jgi:hypothetical protein
MDYALGITLILALYFFGRVSSLKREYQDMLDSRNGYRNDLIILHGRYCDAQEDFALWEGQAFDRGLQAEKHNLALIQQVEELTTELAAYKLAPKLKKRG